MVKKKAPNEPPTVREAFRAAFADVGARVSWQLDVLLDRLGLVRKSRV